MSELPFRLERLREYHNQLLNSHEGKLEFEYLRNITIIKTFNFKPNSCHEQHYLEVPQSTYRRVRDRKDRTHKTKETAIKEQNNGQTTAGYFE